MSIATNGPGPRPTYPASVTASPRSLAPRRWAKAVRAPEHSTEARALPDVPGADPDELRTLAGLGGLAHALAGDQITTWPPALRGWATAVPAWPAELAETARQDLAEGHDPLAAAYDAAIGAENRRRLGTVFTPEPLVDRMLDDAAARLGADPAVVLDPGAGVGAFTVASARRWPDASVLAVDINPVTLGLLGARLAAEDADDSAFGRVELVHDDYLAVLRRTLATSPDGPVLALGNPPYTRSQSLPVEYRRALREQGADEFVGGHANLAVIFLALTFDLLREQDALSMVVPGSVAYTAAARRLRRRLWCSPRPVAVERWPAQTRAFVGRSVQAAVLTVGPVNPDGEPSPLTLSRAAPGPDGSIVELERWTVDRDRRQPDNWFWPADRIRTVPGARATDDLVALPKVATFRRGVATGANALFFLDDDTAARLAPALLVAAIPTLRGFDGHELDETAHAALPASGIRRWLLAVPPTRPLDLHLHEHLESQPDARTRYLCSQREPWWSITDLPSPELLLGPLAKKDFKVVRNLVGAVPSNNMIGITTRGGNPGELADWLRGDEGQLELRRVSRRYQGGSHKLEPGDLRHVRVPASLLGSEPGSGVPSALTLPLAAG